MPSPAFVFLMVISVTIITMTDFFVNRQDSIAYYLNLRLSNSSLKYDHCIFTNPPPMAVYFKNVTRESQRKSSDIIKAASSILLKELDLSLAAGSSLPIATDPVTRTTMTFNTSLVVQCVESPYVKCSPEVKRHVTINRTYRITLLQGPPWLPDVAFQMDLCPRYQECRFTRDNLTEEVDLVVMYGNHLNETVPTPRLREHQEFAIWILESPMHTASPALYDTNSKWKYQFSLIISHMLKFDVIVPYGKVLFKPTPLNERPNYYEIAKKKTKTAIWLVSHPRTQSLRHLFVQEMQKYVDVDIFGRQGRPCPSDEVCVLMSQYKFYLSFENSFCQDYITEKYFKLFEGERPHVIPVVRGAADYDRYLPEFTFVNTAHFKTAKSLALYLKSLGSDLDTYSKYLEYKDLYVKNGSTRDFGCAVCEFLHTRESSKINPLKKYDLHSSLGEMANCYKPPDLQLD